MIVRRLAVSFWLVLLTVSLAVLPAHGQRIAKYGADFLAGGVDARALGMGGAYVAHAHEVSAGYWNPAGLSHLTYPQISYMHVERFAGAVSFDYGAVAFPVNERSTVSLSLFRSGVNDIVNTLNAWDPDRRQPRPNYESRITRFSAADWAVFFGYSRRLSEGLTVGTTFKGIRRTIGDFADAWGYSVDVGAQYRTGPYRFGVTVQDLSTMLQSWSINPDAFRVDCVEERGPNGEPVEYFDACRTEDGSLIEGNAGRFEAIFSQELPEGGTALVLPVVRLGSGAVWPVGPHEVALGLDVDVAFDGQRAFVPNAGDVSFHPRLGGAFSYRGVAELRAGINRIQVGDEIGFDVTPSVGAGLNLAQFSIDFSFGDFTGLTARDLGYTYRISAQLTLEQPGLKRGGGE